MSVMNVGKKVQFLKYRGPFDFEGLYRVMRNWFQQREYDFFEVRYKNKTKPLGYEIEINWEGTREINEYVKNWIKVYFHMWEINEVEVIKNGKKKKVFKGRLQIEFTVFLELDYADNFENSFVKRKWRDFYNNFLIRHEIEDVWWDKIYYNMNKLQQLTKQYLEMESHSDVYDDMW